MEVLTAVGSSREFAPAADPVFASRVILEYISDDSLDAVQGLNDAIEEKTSNLVHHPQFYKAGPVHGTREMAVRTNYAVVYTENEHSVLILRVLHVARQWRSGSLDAWHVKPMVDCNVPDNTLLPNDGFQGVLTAIRRSDSYVADRYYLQSCVMRWAKAAAPTLEARLEFPCARPTLFLRILATIAEIVSDIKTLY